MGVGWYEGWRAELGFCFQPWPESKGTGIGSVFTVVVVLALLILSSLSSSSLNDQRGEERIQDFDSSIIAHQRHSQSKQHLPPFLSLSLFYRPGRSL